MTWPVVEVISSHTSDTVQVRRKETPHGDGTRKATAKVDENNTRPYGTHAL
jgi:hypothetical protein